MLFCRSMDTNKEFYSGLYDEVDVWEGLDDVDSDESISCKALDNVRMPHECSDPFTTYEVNVKVEKYV